MAWDLLKPKVVRYSLAVWALFTGYDTVSSQLELPTIRKVFGMSGALLPWWGWALVLQAILVCALFEYVRRNISAREHDAVDLPAPYDETKLRSEVAALKETLTRVINDYNRMSAVEVKLSERIDKVEKAERSYTDGALVAIGAIEKKQDDAIFSLTARADAQRYAIAAIYHRERLLSLADIAQTNALELVDMLSGGKVLNHDEWDQWQRGSISWQADLHQWSNWAKFYLGREPMDEIRSISEQSFAREWGVKYDQFPDPEGLRVYKTFRTYLENWSNLKGVIHDKVRRQAFEGEQTAERHFDSE